jgi:cell division protein FtsI/penicillin-binding protein 2
VVGHVGRINADELAVFEESGNEKEYTANDTVGKAGAESVFEDKLRGTNGELTVVVNASGRKVSEIEGSQIDPVQGDKIFLTIDAEFQKQCFNILEETLKDVIIAKMTSTDPKAVKISTNELLAQLVRGNNIKSRDYFANSQGKYSDMLKAYVLSVDKNADPNTPEGRKEINEIVATGIETDAVPALNIIMVLIEQGTITADEDYIHSIENELLSPFQVVMEKLQSGEITPQMTNVDPSTGSLVVVDVKTGDILACPTYPTYDVNEYNSNYVNLSEDATLPLINRPFMEPRPPGSTFKMITAAAALENGSVTADTTIYDEVVFTKAGRPEPECMNKAGHGYVDVVHALEVSCNYYFFEAMYRLGNQKDGNELESIGDLDEYMSLFGLDEPTGVEIGELNKSRGKSNLNISSPEYKEYLYSDSDAEPTDWFDGDTAQTAMGQGFNSYTPAVMARYINTIASRGDKFDLHLLNRIETKDEILEYVPKYTSLGSAVSSDTWDLIYEGMRLVIEGPKGTGRRVFEDFPISVAGKTGTAEQFIGIRPDHTSFAGFAPFEEPEIAVYVMLPFSDTTTMSSPATQVARKVMDAYFKLETPPEVNPDINTLIP